MGTRLRRGHQRQPGIPRRRRDLGGAVLLHIAASDPDGERRVWLDLWRGECREARSATVTDEDSARYILSAGLVVWQQVLTGSTAPMMAIMMGKLRITKARSPNCCRTSRAPSSWSCQPPPSGFVPRHRLTIRLCGTT